MTINGAENIVDGKLAISIGQHSDKGIKVENEDFYGVSEPDEPQLTHKGIAVAISDGMSGSEAGKQASRACIIGFLADYFSTPDSWTVKNSVQKILSATNSWLHSNGHSKYQSAKGLVATLSTLIFKSNTAYIFHIGDSRIYRMRENNFEQMTRDHRVDTPDGSSYLNRAMGIEPHLEIDYRTFSLHVGDMFLLTTDGVHDFVTEKELKSYLTDGDEDLQERAEALVKAAITNKSDDNLTCQIVCIESLPLADDSEVKRLNANRPFPPPLEAGMVLDGYRVEAEIHASKRTQIYIAYDTQNNKRVILKTPSVNYEDDPVYIEHFLREEWADKRINDPHVLTVLETDRSKKWIYYVTELIEGVTLREWMNANPKPDISKVVSAVKQITKGLRAFHRLEMLHQDLKPENIMIDQNDQVKVIDFGSVKIAGVAEIQQQPDEEPILGTLNYAAPENILGQRGDVRSDLFSLAVITYEMLNGALPFGREMPELPNRKKLSKLQYVPSLGLNPMVPIWVDGAIKKSVSIDPEKRHEDIFEFLHDLQNPNPDFLSEAKPPLMQRNPVVFWQTICGLLLLSNFILGYLLYSQ